MDDVADRGKSTLLRLLVPSTPWAVGLIVFAAICLGRDASHPVSYDTFLHVYMGEHMLREGEIVEVDPGNWAFEGHYLDHEWLPQVALGAMHLAFGLEGLVLFTALLTGAAFALVAAWMRRRGAGPATVAGLAIAALVALHPFTYARPYLLTWLLAVPWTMLLERLFEGELAPRRWLLAAAALMLLWVNVHAGFLLGFFLLGLFGLAQLWRIVTTAGEERRTAARLFLWMVGGGQLLLFVSGINLYGFRLHAHFLVYMANRVLTTQIREWQSPPFHGAEMTAMLALVGFLLAVGLAARPRLAPAEILLVSALLLVALRAQRNLPIFVLLTLPVFAGRLEEILARLAASDSWAALPARGLRALSRWGAAGGSRRSGTLTAAAAIVAGFLAVGVWKVNPVDLAGRDFPEGAVRFIADNPHLFGGRMFNRYGWGGYLAHQLRPTHRVFINGLQDHYGAAHFWAYQAVVGLRPGWQQILDERGVGWVIFPADTPLAAALDLDPGWRRVHRDSMAEIFVRKDGAASGAAARTVPAWAARKTGELANVLVVVLDTARADAVGAYGAGTAHTPALDRLASQGTLFTHARTTSAWTLPSHGSLFTGLYPSRHGAHWEHQLLGWEQITLAELLAPTHQTGGFSENPHITHAKGFAQGFDEFEETWRQTAATLERVGSWLERRDPKRPFFLFVNLMTPHLPYRPPPAFQDRFLPPSSVDGDEVDRLRGFDEREARLAMSGALELTQREIEILGALYRADVSYTDARLSRLLEALESAGELDETLVVAVGDHGENIGEHALFEHQHCLYETLLRVPMVLRLPGTIAAARRSAAPVQLTDVAPTVLEAVGMPRDLWPELEGQSLLRAEPPADRPVVAEYMRSAELRKLFAEADPGFEFDSFDRRLKSIQVGSAKLILADGGPAELYDLAADPGETRNLAAERPQLAAALRARLEAWSDERQPAGGGEREPTLDEATKKALRALGYLD